ncbi:DUF3097 domain-containing protein [Saccharopolyspora griseoalba]|uniref:DUF3097 domain-containing protein n=1 Tax=Saccharopolyspora griseoalba TaxID=1431848 RepID=A0ABW2LGC6_9PSEU
MRSVDYGADILSGKRRKKVPEIAAEPDLVVEDAASGFCGAVVRVEKDNVVLEDRHGKQRLFPMRPAAFLHEGEPATLVAPRRSAARGPSRSASGSVKVEGLRARTARGSRIWVEGLHDAELVERIWGHDLRVEGVVVEPLHGVDDLPGLLAEFAPGPGRRVGVLVDHLVAGSKESRLVEDLDHEHVLVTGHPFVDVWQAVKPAAVGIEAWPQVPRDEEWKQGVCDRLGWGDPREGWRRVLAGATGFRDVEPPLLTAVEQLIDFVTAEG